MVREIIQQRVAYYKQSSISDLLIEGEHFVYICEDTVRPDIIKVIDHTAIPENKDGYKVSIRYSPSLRREVLILYTEDDKVTIKVNNIEFKYIQCHSGNTHVDTSGCPIPGNTLTSEGVGDSKNAEVKLFNLVKSWIDNSDHIRWYIYNNPQV